MKPNRTFGVRRCKCMHPDVCGHLWIGPIIQSSPEENNVPGDLRVRNAEEFASLYNALRNYVAGDFSVAMPVKSLVAPPGGMTCSCGYHNPDAGPNQPNGSYKCYECRNG